MKRAIRIRIYPTASQQQVLAHQFGCARWVWNDALAETQRLYQETGKGLSFLGMCYRLPSLKQEYAWLKDADSQVLQKSLKDLGASFQNFFEKRARFPRFKVKAGRQSICYPQRVKIKGNKIYLPKVGWIKAVVHRQGVGTLKSVTVSKNTSDQYHAALLFEDDQALPVVSIDGPAIGIDLGLTHWAITSTGEKVDHPRCLKEKLNKVKRLQRQLSKKQKGSQNRKKVRKKLARAHQRIADARRDHLHKLSHRLISENQVIVVEDLHVRGMMRNHTLAQAIADASWSELVRQLQYKAAWSGKAVIQVDRWYPSSKTCSQCGYIHRSLKIKDRHWVCPRCHTVHDRDVNAAKNILAEGKRMLAAGAVATACGGVGRRGAGRPASVHAHPREAGSPRL